MSLRLALCFVAFGLFLLVGCSGPQPPLGPQMWGGATPHIEVYGQINGEKLDFKITGSDAMDTAKLSCQREYTVPTRADGGTGADGGVIVVRDYSRGYLNEVRWNGLFTTPDAGTRLFELEFKKHNTQADSPGTRVTVVPRSATDPGPREMWFEWEWHTADKSQQLLEVAAESGEFTLGEYTGTKDGTGLLIPDNTGTMGGYLTARWSETDSIKMSATAKCTRTRVLEVPQ